MKYLLILLSSIGLVACNNNPEYSVEYLYKNNDIREQVLQDCKQNKQSDLNCRNANEAHAKRFNETNANKKVQQWK